jgi:hypothetical protein
MPYATDSNLYAQFNPPHPAFNLPTYSIIQLNTIPAAFRLVFFFAATPRTGTRVDG